MVAVHLMQMKLSGQALNGGNPEPRSCAIAGKLARTYAMQLETMAKLKGVVLLLALALVSLPTEKSSFGSGMGSWLQTSRGAFGGSSVCKPEPTASGGWNCSAKKQYSGA